MLSKYSSSGLTIAVVGATGLVGSKVIQLLNGGNLPVMHLIPLASAHSAGRDIVFQDRPVKVQDLTLISGADLAAIDICIMAAGSAVAQEWAPVFAKHGAMVIDNSSYYRMDEDVPLVVPEVNGHVLRRRNPRRIIANPNCSSAQLVVALQALKPWRIKRVTVSTYQSVSGAGQKGLDRLRAEQSQCPQPRQFAHNVVPHVDVFLPGGETKEEWKMRKEIPKILGLPRLRVHATCVRVPVEVGHSESVNVEFGKPVDLNDIHWALKDQPGLTIAGKLETYHTPLEIAGLAGVYVSRLRQDETVRHGISFWCVADNLLKGAALNAVQIARWLHHHNLLAAA